MQPTDTANPDYYHKVVDCQWACPAHTNVPEYIRLIAQGRYTDAYMLNRESNVFPGILGRTCDRPCEPACRRGRARWQSQSRSAASNALRPIYRGDIEGLLPPIPDKKNGKRVACIGAGPASLAVANDLMPHGYEVTIFEKLDKPGGLMRTNIPSFRLPASVLDGEIDSILNMGVDIRYNSPDREHGGAARTELRRRLHRQRRATRQESRICPAATKPIAFTSASTGSAPLLSAIPIRSARAF